METSQEEIDEVAVVVVAAAAMTPLRHMSTNLHLLSTNGPIQDRVSGLVPQLELRRAQQLAIQWVACTIDSKPSERQGQVHPLTPDTTTKIEMSQDHSGTHLLQGSILDSGRPGDDDDKDLVMNVRRVLYIQT